MDTGRLVAYPADRQPRRSQDRERRGKPERCPEAIAFLQKQGSVGVTRCRRTAGVLDDRGRHQSVGPAHRPSTQGEVDVFVVQEIPFVEAASLHQEIVAEQHRRASEDRQVRGGSGRLARFAVADVGAGAETVEPDAEAVHDRWIGPGMNQLRLRCPHCPCQLGSEWVEPARRHHHVVVEDGDQVSAAPAGGFEAEIGGSTVPVVVGRDVLDGIVGGRGRTSRVDHDQMIDRAPGPDRCKTGVERRRLRRVRNDNDRDHGAYGTVPAVTATTLVAGGAGYIGSHTVRALTEAGRSVVVYDSLELGTAEAVGDAPLVVGDIADEALIESTCRDYGVDSIVHLAAYKNVGESMVEPYKYFRNNIDGTVRLLEAAVRADVRQVVFSSSCSVYGTPPYVPVDEAQPIAPESVYAETKAIAERVLKWYGEVHGLRSVSLRYFNAAGASFDSRIGEDWTYALNLIPVAIRALLTKADPIAVFGDDYPTPDGTCIRDYIHVDDLAAAHIAAIDYLAGDGATTAVNVGTGLGSSVLEVLQAIADVAGEPVPHEIVGRRAGDPTTTYADPSVAQQLLGWQSRYGLDEIIDTAYRWHLKQRDEQHTSSA